MSAPRIPEAWLQAMGATELPVLERTVLELARLREDIDRVTTQQLAEIVMHDPIMTFKVLRYIQQRRTRTLRVDVTTIAHALMMLGMNPFLEHFAEQETLQARLADNPAALAGALNVISRARHAAMYARDWAVLRHDIEVDEVTTAALLHDLAELLLWIHKPEIAVDMHARQREHHARSESVQREVLGFPLIALQVELAHKWQLPDLLSELMDERHAHTPRALNVVVAVALARHSANGWNDAALPDDFAALGQLIGLDPDAARARVLRVALKVAMDWEWYGVPPSAAQLPLLAA
ncbi:MAG TPA: HDOD domain-containing protein [Burkholderiales bacterium]|nr:HDOD domain-containing protein [Burkholderiales bacterium]